MEKHAESGPEAGVQTTTPLVPGGMPGDWRPAIQEKGRPGADVRSAPREGLDGIAGVRSVANPEEDWTDGVLRSSWSAFGGVEGTDPFTVMINGIEPEEGQVIAIKAFGRITDSWSLTAREAAALLNMSESTWMRARNRGHPERLTVDQMTRIGAVLGLYEGLDIYFNPPLSKQWITLPNRGPEFKGQRPVDFMIRGGTRDMIRLRSHVGALCWGL